jgi:hypothetical protein
MNRQLAVLDLLIGAMMKLNPHNGERQNVMAFIQSCYGGIVRSYDLERAVSALAKLTDAEQHALITWELLDQQASGRRRVVAA